MEKMGKVRKVGKKKGKKRKEKRMLKMMRKKEEEREKIIIKRGEKEVTGRSYVDEVSEKIKNLEIQGARNVARSALEAIVFDLESTSKKNKDEVISDILTNADKLANLRVTEPMLENLLKNFVASIIKGRTVDEIKKIAKTEERNFKAKMDENLEKIIGYGTNLIRENSTVLTHCHSSTVESILKRAALVKNIRVMCTETRPLYQGRITAKNLARAGIDTTLIVDSCVNYIIKDVDIVLVGADVVTARGTLINKIGTSMIASIAYENKVPFYSACELWKFDPNTKWGIQRNIEMRDGNELISDMSEEEKNKFGVKILNPAFDATDDRYINGYITEEGIIPPAEISRYAEKLLKSK